MSCDHEIRYEDFSIGRVIGKGMLSVIFSFEHPSIVRMYGYFEDIEYIWLVLGLYQHDLAQFLNCWACDEDIARRILRQIIQGLVSLYQYNVINRDLKLEMFFWQTKQRLKLRTSRKLLLFWYGELHGPELHFGNNYQGAICFWKLPYTMLAGKPRKNSR